MMRAVGRWNPPSGAGSDTYWDGIEERMTLFGKSEKQEGFFSKLKAAVASTKNNLVARIEDVVKGKKVIDAELLEDLEAVLIGADIGAQTTSEILEKMGRAMSNPFCGSSRPTQATSGISWNADNSGRRAGPVTGVSTILGMTASLSQAMPSSCSNQSAVCLV